MYWPPQQLTSGTARADTRTEQLIPVDHDKHISDWREEDRRRKQQGKTKSAKLLLCLVFFASNILFVFFSIYD